LNRPRPTAGIEEAKEGGRLLKEAGFTFDKAYTSMLRRAIKTCWLVLEEASALQQHRGWACPRINQSTGGLTDWHGMALPRTQHRWT